jgi:hypothetical protein
VTRVGFCLGDGDKRVAVAIFDHAAGARHSEVIGGNKRIVGDGAVEEAAASCFEVTSMSPALNLWNPFGGRRQHLGRRRLT